MMNELLEDVIEQHITDMKYRESVQRNLRDEAQLKAEAIMHERMVLEDFIYKHQERVKHLKSLEK